MRKSVFALHSDRLVARILLILIGCSEHVTQVTHSWTHLEAKGTTPVEADEREYNKQTEDRISDGDENEEGTIGLVLPRFLNHLISLLPPPIVFPLILCQRQPVLFILSIQHLPPSHVVLLPPSRVSTSVHWCSILILMKDFLFFWSYSETSVKVSCKPTFSHCHFIEAALPTLRRKDRICELLYKYKHTYNERCKPIYLRSRTQKHRFNQALIQVRNLKLYLTNPTSSHQIRPNIT